MASTLSEETIEKCFCSGTLLFKVILKTNSLMISLTYDREKATVT
jgi:hypothetical protein